MNPRDYLLEPNRFDQSDSLFRQDLPYFEVLFIAETYEGLSLGQILDQSNGLSMDCESAEYLSKL